MLTLSALTLGLMLLAIGSLGGFIGWWTARKDEKAIREKVDDFCDEATDILANAPPPPPLCARCRKPCERCTEAMP